MKVVGAYRQDGYVAVEAGKGIEIETKAVNMEEIFHKRSAVSGARAFRDGDWIFVQALKYSQPESSLSLNVTRHELQKVISCIVPSAQLQDHDDKRWQ